MFKFNSCLVNMSLSLADEYEAGQITLIADLDGSDIDTANPLDGVIVNSLMSAIQFDSYPIGPEQDENPCFANAEIGSQIYVSEAAPVMLTPEMVKAFHGIVPTHNVMESLTPSMAARLREYFSMLDNETALLTRLNQLVSA